MRIIWEGTDIYAGRRFLTAETKLQIITSTHNGIYHIVDTEEGLMVCSHPDRVSIANWLTAAGAFLPKEE